MSGKVFFDANIVVYAFERQAGRKGEIARELLRDAAISGTGFISYQIIQEFLNVGFKRFIPRLSAVQASDYVRELMQDFTVVPWSPGLVLSGIALRDRYQSAWYDSLMMAAAIQAGCDLLYSEDGQHGQRIDSLRIMNPFMDK